MTTRKVAVLIISVLAIGATVTAYFLLPNRSELNSVKQLPKLFESVDHHAEIESKPSLVHFWASWCGPCRDEMPGLLRGLNRLAARYNVYLVSVDEDLERAKIFLSEIQTDQKFQSYFYSDARSDLSRKWGTNKIPETYFFDSKGRLVRKVAGEMDWQSPKSQKFLFTEN